MKARRSAAVDSTGSGWGESSPRPRCSLHLGHNCRVRIRVCLLVRVCRRCGFYVVGLLPLVLRMILEKLLLILLLLLLLRLSVYILLLLVEERVSSSRRRGWAVEGCIESRGWRVSWRFRLVLDGR